MAHKGILVNASAIAEPFLQEVASSVAKFPRKLHLLGILANSSPASRTYADYTRKQCDRIGVNFTLKCIGSALDDKMNGGEGIEEAIIEANEDEEIDGLMVYYPIFYGQRDHYLQQIVSPLKDVEGLHAKFHFNLYHNIRFIKPSSLMSIVAELPESSNSLPSSPPPGMVKSIIPCTPLAAVKVLESLGVYNTRLRYGDRVYGKTITVINRSEVVGRPLAALLSNDGARVFSVDIDSIQEYTKRPSASLRMYHQRHVVASCNLSLHECLALSDAVISAVPNSTYKIPTEKLKDGCICVNISGEKNFETDIREKVCHKLLHAAGIDGCMTGKHILPKYRKSYHFNVIEKLNTVARIQDGSIE